MRILIIRHGEPDYAHDTLTEKGWREAELLSQRLEKEDIKKIYVSPLGRARDTAKPTLVKKGMEATVCDWLQEFPVRVDRSDMNAGKNYVLWDWLPDHWTENEEFYDAEKWTTGPIIRDSTAYEELEKVKRGFDEILFSHGYVREKKYYRAVEPNTDTIAFFCHFGLECVLLAHLMGISPMPLWHGLCAPASSVTTVYTEERREGVASFRAFGFGDTSHLYAAGEPLSFAARWRETYNDPSGEIMI